MKHFETRLAQIGNRSENITGTVNPPVYFSTAYRHEGIGKSSGFDYIRSGNPTRQLLEEAIAELEGGDKGFACSSGMAAITLVLSLFQSGDELIVSNDLYGGTFRLLNDYEKKWDIRCRYVNMQNVSEITSSLSPQTKAIFLETPTNPLMQTADIEVISSIANKYNILLIVDNTFYTPLLQQPLRLGGDIVIHSATKYLGGHNDVLGGLVVAKGEALCESLAYNHNSCGAVLSPFDSWLLMRGMKTLALRISKHEENAQALVTYLQGREEVQDVLYPGRGGMLSFRLQKEEWINPFLQSLTLITFAESLGGVESFITYPATQTHADVPIEIRTARGLDNRLLRFSVGIENIKDLIEDLQQAFTTLHKEVEA